MSNLTADFESFYARDEQNLENILKHGFVVLDANVLLNCYRYATDARKTFLDILESIQDRLFIPYQVALEFNRHRFEVACEVKREYDSYTQNIKNSSAEIGRTVKSMADRRSISMSPLDALVGDIESKVEELIKAMSKHRQSHDVDQATIAKGEVDPILAKLNEILDGCVETRPNDRFLEDARREGTRRHTEKLAPGFADAGIGDYLWWAEVLASQRLKGSMLLVVTNDLTKHDWLDDAHSGGGKGNPIGGPHQILFDDAKKNGIKDFHIISQFDFMSNASTITDGHIKSETFETLRPTTETSSLMGDDDHLGNASFKTGVVPHVSATRSGLPERVEEFALLSSENIFLVLMSLLPGREVDEDDERELLATLRDSGIYLVKDLVEFVRDWKGKFDEYEEVSPPIDAHGEADHFTLLGAIRVMLQLSRGQASYQLPTNHLRRDESAPWASLTQPWQ